MLLNWRIITFNNYLPSKACYSAILHSKPIKFGIQANQLLFLLDTKLLFKIIMCHKYGFPKSGHKSFQGNYVLLNISREIGQYFLVMKIKLYTNSMAWNDNGSKSNTEIESRSKVL